MKNSKNKTFYSGWENEDEKIKRAIRVSAEEKLRWLREFNEFTDSILSARQKKIRRKIKLAS